jgi:hypothetical protein
MTLTQIAKRVSALEKTVQNLAEAKSKKNRRWYRTHAGRFANDPAFKEIVKLGRSYRQSLRKARPQ